MNVIRQVLALLALVTMVAGATQAEVWNSYRNCIAPGSMGTDPQTLLQDPTVFTRSGIILTWYIHGATPFPDANPDAVLPFADCFDVSIPIDCGIPKNAAMTTTLRGPDGPQALQPGGALYNYFEAAPPPPAAIAYAGQNIGTCFGDDNIYVDLYRSFDQGEFDVEVCRRLSDRMLEHLDAEGMSLNPEFLRQIEWGIMFGQTWFESDTCPFYPKYGGDLVKKYRAEIAAERTKAARDAKFAGLNGCQIAYGYVFHGINATSGITRRVPDGAISWALDYEQANLDNEDCPVMPQVLSEWVMEQPLEIFQPAPDPYTALRRRTRPVFGNDHAAWTYFAKAWMERYELVDASKQCQDVKDYVFGTNGNNLSPNSAEAAFRRLMYLAEKAPERRVATPAICAFTPDYVWPKVQQYHAAQVADRAAAERQRKINEARTQQSIDRWAPPPQQNYLWTNAPTTRCYRAGDTKYGSRQVCFTN